MMGTGAEVSNDEMLRFYLTQAGLSIRNGAQALRLDTRTLRGYCSGKLYVPYRVMVSASKLQLRNRKLVCRRFRVMRMLESRQFSACSGALTACNGPLTCERLLATNQKLLRVIDYLIDRPNRI